MTMSVRLYSILTLLLAGFFSRPALARHVVRDQFIVFDSDEEALAWYAKNQPQAFKKIIPFTDARYKPQRELIAKVWQGFQKLYPERTKDLPVPVVVIVDIPDPDGWVDKEAGTDLFPCLFTLTAPVTTMNPRGTAGLMGHELTHLLFGDFKDKYYQLNGNDEPLGFLQPDDPYARKLVQEWLKLTKVVGPFLIDELNDLPVKFTYDGALFSLMTHAAQTYGDASRPTCKRAGFPTWAKKLTRSYLSYADFAVYMTPDERKELDQLTEAYADDLKGCLGDKKIPFTTLAASNYGDKAPEIVKEWASEIAIFDSYSNLADSFIGLSTKTYQSMRLFKQKHDLPSLRWYSNEEVADDTSARVLKSMGIKPTEFGDFWLQLIEMIQPGNKAKCLKQLENNNIPSYGILSDPHHAPCFRVWHLREMARHLGSSTDS